MYSDDLAYVIEKCIYNEIYDSFNVSNSENVSINEIAKIALKACDADYLEIEYDSEKPDGQYRKDVSNQKLQKAIPEFSPTTLIEGIKTTYSKINKASY